MTSPVQPAQPVQPTQSPVAAPAASAASAAPAVVTQPPASATQPPVAPQQPRPANSGYTTGRRMAAGRLKLTYVGSMRAELTKLLSIRSTYWLLGITLLLITAGAALSAWSYKEMASLSFDEQTGAMTTLAEPRPMDGSDVWTSLVGIIPTVAIVIGIFGIMAITSEYTNLTVQSGLVANPRRGMYLAAKATVVGILSFLTSLLGLLLGWVALRVVLAGVTVNPLPDSQRMLPLICLLGGPAICMAMAWLALGLGAICRSTVSGVFALIGVWMILPSILAIATMSEKSRPVFQSIVNCLPDRAMSDFLNGSVTQALMPGYDPSAYGIIGGGSRPDYFDPTWWQSGLIFVAWVAVVYAIGTAVMSRADVK